MPTWVKLAIDGSGQATSLTFWTGDILDTLGLR
jgi:hypothetical protein